MEELSDDVEKGMRKHPDAGIVPSTFLPNRVRMSSDSPLLAVYMRIRIHQLFSREFSMSHCSLLPRDAGTPFGCFNRNPKNPPR